MIIHIICISLLLVYYLTTIYLLYLNNFIFVKEYWVLRGRDTIVWFTCKRYEKMLFLEIY